MSKPKTVPTNVSPKGEEINAHEGNKGIPEPLSGSHKVKNRNHSRNNHGEGF